MKSNYQKIILFLLVLSITSIACGAFVSPTPSTITLEPPNSSADSIDTTTEGVVSNGTVDYVNQ